MLHVGLILASNGPEPINIMGEVLHPSRSPSLELNLSRLLSD